MIEPNVPPSTSQSMNGQTNPIQDSDFAEQAKEPLIGKESILDVPNELVFQQDYEQPAYMWEARTSGYDKLSSVKGAYVKQKFSFCKSLVGCIPESKYYVYGLPDDGIAKRGSKMFKCEEKSNGCMRQFCLPQCRSYKMEMKNKDYIDKDFDEEPFLTFNRPFKCTFLCFGRPEVEIEWNEAGRRNILGRIKNPSTCCHLVMEVLDAIGNPRYQIRGSCCQAGIMCNAACCHTARFDIIDMDQNVVGSISQIDGTTRKDHCKSLTNFKIIYPELAKGEDRALLTAATILTDYQYFEKRFAGLCPINCACIWM